MATVANDTNIWQSQPQIDLTPFYIIIAGIAVVIGVITIFLVWRKKVP